MTKDRKINNRIAAVIYWENLELEKRGYTRCAICHGSGFVWLENTICMSKPCDACKGSNPPGWIKNE
jgi:hypothetical protein